MGIGDSGIMVAVGWIVGNGVSIGSSVLVGKSVLVGYRNVVAVNCTPGVFVKFEFVAVGIGEIGNNHCPNAGIRAIAPMHIAMTVALATIISRIVLALVVIVPHNINSVNAIVTIWPPN